MSAQDQNTGDKPILPAFPCLARVVSYADSTFMGRLEVMLLRQGPGNTESTTQVVQVDMISPFWGNTGRKFVTADPDDYNSTQKSYGMWFIPPDYGSTVVVIFLNGDPSRGYWLGGVPSEHMNFSVPGLAATEFVVEQDGEKDNKGNAPRLPVAEFNKEVNNPEFKVGDGTKTKKPKHPFADILTEQGLVLDDIRGITTSSARREAPSQVFGVSTPGPVDYKDGATRGPVGKEESEYPNAFVSRLGGSTFVMDDGDTTFRRRKKAFEGPPDYAAILNKEFDGLPDVPHNELIRLRTRTGHQILLHNSEDLIYIGNARGTSWIELSSDGKIDIYAEDSISVHTKQDINFLADRDINFEAKRNFNIKVGEEMHTHVIKNQLLVVDGEQQTKIKENASFTYESDYLSSAINYHVTSSKNYNLKVDADFNLKVKVNGQIETTGNLNILTTGNNFIQATKSTEITSEFNRLYAKKINHINADSQVRITANNSAGKVWINSSAEAEKQTIVPKVATVATEIADEDVPKILKTFSLPDETGEELTQAIVTRVPTHEPWPHHENLDPLTFKAEELDRDSKGRYEENDESLVTPPDSWKSYTTVYDTFNPPPPEEEEQ